MNGMYLEDLIILFSCSCKCGIPGCNKTAEWFHARCHPGGGVKVEFTEKIVMLSCNICKKPIIPIFYDSISIFKKIETLKAKENTIVNVDLTKCTNTKCLINTGLMVKYKNEKLEFYCNTCKIQTAFVIVTKKDKTKN